MIKGYSGTYKTWVITCRLYRDKKSGGFLRGRSHEPESEWGFLPQCVEFQPKGFSTTDSFLVAAHQGLILAWLPSYELIGTRSRTQLTYPKGRLSHSPGPCGILRDFPPLFIIGHDMHNDQVRFHCSLTSPSSCCLHSSKTQYLIFFRTIKNSEQENSHPQYTVAKMPNSSSPSFFLVYKVQGKSVNLPSSHTLQPTIVHIPTLHLLTSVFSFFFPLLSF